MAKTTIGLLSGLFFGAGNVGVQVVAYLDSLDLDRSTFVGVLAMILVGISTLRVGMAWSLGFYAALGLLGASTIAAIPGVLGVAVGARIGRFLSESVRIGGTFVLLTIIGVRLTLNGITGL